MEAEWAAYFKKVAEIMKLYPYEKERCLSIESLAETS